MRTAQELFDISVNHLRKQNAKSHDVTGFVCAYRGEGGRMCAIGPLITNEDYVPGMEGNNLKGLLYDLKLPDHMMDEFGTNRELLIELQDTHDHSSMDHWELRWQNIAKKFNLVYTPKDSQ